MTSHLHGNEDETEWTTWSVFHRYTRAELIYLCATDPLLSRNLRRWPVVFVDEAQDTNPATFEMLCRMTSERQVSVGDEAQTLYYWLGVRADHWENLSRMPNAIVVNCPITYRCPRSVVAFAQQYVPRLRAAPDAIDGAVISVRQAEMFRHLLPGHVFVTLTNADAISIAIACLEAGMGAFVKGREVGTMLYALCEQLARRENFAFERMVNFIKSWMYAQLAVIEKMSANPARQMAQVIDRARGLEALYVGAVRQGVSNLEEFRQYVQGLFSERNSSVIVLALTAWKAKGEEYDHVWAYDSDLLVSPGVDWRARQARNAAYVIATRTRETLYILSGDGVSHSMSRLEDEDIA